MKNLQEMAGVEEVSRYIGCLESILFVKTSRKFESITVMQYELCIFETDSICSMIHKTYQTNKSLQATHIYGQNA